MARNDQKWGWGAEKESCICCEILQSPHVVESEKRIRPQQGAYYRAGDETEKSALENRKEWEDYLLDPQARVASVPR